jgi:hypothetical protein
MDEDYRADSAVRFTDEVQKQAVKVEARCARVRSMAIQ